MNKMILTYIDFDESEFFFRLLEDGVYDINYFVQSIQTYCFESLINYLDYE